MFLQKYYWAVMARLYSKFGPIRCLGRIRIIGYPVVKGSGRVVVGGGTDLRSESWATAMGVMQPCLFNCLLETSIIEVGDECGMSGVVICAKERVTIGSRVQIGSGALICDTDFHSMDYRMRGQSGDLDEAQVAPVTIGDDCFIGARSMILKGVTIGPRSIVGAGTIVVKDVPPDVVVAGNPARILKQLNES